MREILFKAKRLDNGEWVEGYYFAQGNGCDSLLSYIKRVTDTVHVDPATVCEFTGLRDKNGVRIFEGDIVWNGYTCNYPNGQSSDFFDNGVVFMEWQNGCWSIKNDDGAPKRLTRKMITERNIKVIGSIHDNKGGE